MSYAVSLIDKSCIGHILIYSIRFLLVSLWYVSMAKCAPIHSVFSIVIILVL